MKRLLTLAIVMACGLGLSADSKPAAAASGYLRVTYEVQVEYWFFDTDYSYWKTVFSSADRDDAEFVYDLLVLAKQNNQLNTAAPNEYWRYIAVDVRMVAKYTFVPLQIRAPAISGHDFKIRIPLSVKK